MIIANITNRGLIINNKILSGTISDKVYKLLLSKFTVTEVVPKVKNVKRFGRCLRGFIYDNDDIIFTRMTPIFLPVFNKLIDQYIQSENIPININIDHSIIEYYDYQTIAANHVVELFETQHAAYIQLDTGMGKTLLAAAIFEKMAVKTIIVCMSIGLVKQMITDFLLAFPTLSIIHYEESKKHKINYLKYDVLVFVNITFSEQDMTIFNDYKLLIIDEAHLYTSETNLKILWKTQNFDNVLALSATPIGHPNRLDHFPLLFFGHPIEVAKLENTNIVESVFDVKVNKIEYFGDETKPWCMNAIQGDTISAVSTVGNISRDPHRNQMIANIIMKLREKNHGVMIFSELRDHLVRIQEYLKHAGIESEISVLMSGVADDTLETAREYKEHVVLTTYGYSRVGISLVSMTALILASPRRNGIGQVLGRILRKGSDETIVRQIYDIVDMNIGLKSQYTTRSKVYKERKYPIIIEKITYKDINYKLVEKKIIEEAPIIDQNYQKFIDKLIANTK